VAHLPLYETFLPSGSAQASV